MLLAVIDPGVLVAGLAAPEGVTGQLVAVVRTGRVRLVVSPLLLDELTGVALRAKFHPRFDAPTVHRLIEQLVKVAVLVEDPIDPPAVTRDPKDDYLVALAVAASADVLVSGDKDLTDLADPPLPVLTPRAFLEQLVRESAEQQ